jgi:hypothetical protein
MKIRVVIFSIVSFLYLSPVAAESGDGFIGLQYGQAEDGDSKNYDYALARIGAHITDEIAIEYRAGKGVGDRTKVDGIKVKIERLTGVYGSYHYYLTDTASVYGIAGWSKVKVEGSLNGASVTQSSDGASYGAGIEYNGFNVEWMQYLDTDDIDATAIGVGYNFWL